VPLQVNVPTTSCASTDPLCVWMEAASVWDDPLACGGVNPTGQTYDANGAYQRHSDVRINPNYSQWSGNPNTTTSHVAHELGHLLGLDPVSCGLRSVMHEGRLRTKFRECQLERCPSIAQTVYGNQYGPSVRRDYGRGLDHVDKNSLVVFANAPLVLATLAVYITQRRLPGRSSTIPVEWR
jgi:hypothetical protein